MSQGSAKPLFTGSIPVRASIPVLNPLESTPVTPPTGPDTCQTTLSAPPGAPKAPESWPRVGPPLAQTGYVVAHSPYLQNVVGELVFSLPEDAIGLWTNMHKDDAPMRVWRVTISFDPEPLQFPDPRPYRPLTLCYNLAAERFWFALSRLTPWSWFDRPGCRSRIAMWVFDRHNAAARRFL